MVLLKTAQIFCKELKTNELHTSKRNSPIQDPPQSECVTR